jgi:hypothetical protein
MKLANVLYWSLMFLILPSILRIKGKESSNWAKVMLALYNLSIRSMILVS